jgi:hypothetical protein
LTEGETIIVMLDRKPDKEARSPAKEANKPPAAASRSDRRGVVLDHEASYSVSTKALGKWSRERLRLTAREDRGVEAWFRFEGTTCSNLGRPLAFDYRIVLGPPEGGYRIVAVSCMPAPGDDGYTSMCKYLKDAGALMAAIEAEQPLLGRPLDDVLAWERRFSPTGCYCDAAGRAHKWGIALEAVHYALAQAEKQRLRQQQDETALKLQP